MLDGGGACVFPERSIGVAGGARSFRDNEHTQNEEDENGNQQHIPAAESCGGAWRGRGQAPLKRAIVAPVDSELSFVSSGPHKSSCNALQCLPGCVWAHLSIKTYRITIWLQREEEAIALAVTSKGSWSLLSKRGFLSVRPPKSESLIYANSGRTSPRLFLLPFRSSCRSHPSSRETPSRSVLPPCG